MSSITPVRDPVAGPYVALLEVFGAHADVLRFPDIDHDTLVDLAEQVRETAAEVARCEQALARCKDALSERQATLRHRIERGLAYAQIYAQDDEPLREQLELIELSPTRTTSKGKTKPKRPPRRTRTRKTKPAVADQTVTELPFDPNEAPTAVA